MLLAFQATWWEDWLLYHKVIFDGENKIILIDPTISSISVKEDIYSAWKEWVSLRDHAKYAQAMRTIGGDPVGGGQYAGDMYFLMNGWQIHVDHNIKLNGILYHDDVGVDPYVILPSGGVVATVSSLAYAYNTTGATAPTVVEIRNELDANSTKLIQTITKLDAITAYVDELESRLSANRAAKLDNLDIKTSDIWNVPTSNMTTPGSIGEWFVKKVLTVTKFIGLK